MLRCTGPIVFSGSAQESLKGSVDQASAAGGTTRREVGRCPALHSDDCLSCAMLPSEQRQRDSFPALSATDSRFTEVSLGCEACKATDLYFQLKSLYRDWSGWG